METMSEERDNLIDVMFAMLVVDKSDKERYLKISEIQDVINKIHLVSNNYPVLHEYDMPDTSVSSIMENEHVDYVSLDDEIGSIEVGKKADIILIDTNSANMVPASSSLSSNVIYSANGSNVDTTICNGKILMENRKLTFLDEDEIYSKARNAIKQLKEAI